MPLKAILNSIEKHKGFVYEKIERTEDNETILVNIRARKGSKGCCSGCGKKGRTYDHLPVRRFQYVPLWGIAVYFVYAMRRIDCLGCGPTVEMVPWADGKRHVTNSFLWFLSSWAKRLSWKETAAVFKTSWETVFRCVEAAVVWGRTHINLDGISAIGIDEIHWGSHSKFMTLIYQIDEQRKRLLWVANQRKEESLETFFVWFGKERTSLLKYICSDMWKPYINVIKTYASEAVHVLDRFHIMSHFSKAIDEVRANEAREMKKQGYEPILRHSRWCLLKRPENLTEKQEIKLADLLKFNLRSVRAYLLKEDFQSFWEYTYPNAAAKFLDSWCFKAMRSKIEPIKAVARMIRSHRDILLNWFKARGAISIGAVEGLNNKAKVGTKLAYGFRTFRAHQVALYHRLGDLPEPSFIHKFC